MGHSRIPSGASSNLVFQISKNISIISNFAKSMAKIFPDPKSLGSSI
jgi:hypothetical protein